MTLLACIDALCALELSLSITSPVEQSIKSAQRFTPGRSAIIDMPGWINAWALSDVVNWGDLRVERYTVTSQLFVKDADIPRAATIATQFHSAFCKAWDEGARDLQGTTVGTELRSRDPTLGMLEWQSIAYPGLTLLLDVDVPVRAAQTFVDPALDALRAWTYQKLPTCQQEPTTWVPADDAPVIYWHYVTLPAAQESDYRSFDLTMVTATMGARVVTPSSVGRVTAIRNLAGQLGIAELDQVQMPDTSFLTVSNVRVSPEIDPRSRAQVQFDALFALDNTPYVLSGTGGDFGDAFLTFTETPVGVGPTIEAEAPGPNTRPATPVSVSLA